MAARNVLASLPSALALVLALGAIAVGCAGQPAPPNPGGAGSTIVSVYDPTGQSQTQISWPAYPAPPPPGFHWQHTGSPAIQVDPQGRPLPGQNTGSWILVRDGYQMPMVR